MTTHQLAKILLDMPDSLAVTFDEDGLYTELSTVIPAALYRRETYHSIVLNVPANPEQKAQSFKVLLIT